MKKCIFLYSSDFHGFGHFTRNLKIATFLSQNKNYIIYLVTNKYFLREELPKNVKILKMPKINVVGRPRDYRYLKDLPKEIKNWSNYLIDLIKQYKPMLFYNDLNPNGGYGELRYVLPYIKKNNINTIIGLRDILDSKQQTKKEWMN